MVFKNIILLSLVYSLFGGISTGIPLQEYTEVLEGQDLIEHCNAQGYPAYSIYWMRNNTFDRFSVQDTTLFLEKIKRTQDGFYLCFAFNSTLRQNVTLKILQVNVIYETVVSDMSIQPSVLRENDDFTVICNVTGNPAPIWSIRNLDTGEQYYSSNQSEILYMSMRAKCEMTGRWVCTGYNRLNLHGNATQQRNMTVYCSPQPSPFVEYNVDVSIGDSASLVMTLLPSVLTNFYNWSKDDGTAIRASRIDDRSSTRLDFSNIQVSDLGGYHVNVRNDIGEYNAKFTLDPYGFPQTPTNFRFSDVTADSVKLYWTSGFDNGRHQQFVVYKPIDAHESIMLARIDDTSSNHGVNQHWSYVLGGLTSNTIYNLTIASQNNYNFMSAFATPYISFVTLRSGPEPTSNSSSAEIPMSVWIASGSVAFIFLLAVTIYLIRRRRRLYKKI